MEVAIIILGAFVLLLFIVAVLLGNKYLKAKNRLKEVENKQLSQSQVTKSSDQEWSEEDEELLNGFIKEVESELKRPYLKGDDLILNKKISWLKALKQRLVL